MHKINGHRPSISFLSLRQVTDRLFNHSVHLSRSTGTNLQGSDLTDANVTEVQLTICKSLEGATMPDGSKHD